MTNEVLNRHANLKIYPAVVEIDETINHVSVGDLHGNALKLIYTLIQEGFLTLKNGKDDYDKLVALYSSKKSWTRNPNDPKKLTIEDLNSFRSIIQNATCNNARALTLIGDVLCDRGNNDYFTLLVLKKLKKERVDVDIMLSNHDMEFIRDYERDKFTGKSNLDFTQCLSLRMMRCLIDDGRIDETNLRKLIKDVYVPMVKAIGYTISPDKQTISLFTHAPVGLETIQALAVRLGIVYREDSIDELITTIDAINARVNEELMARELSQIMKGEEATITTPTQKKNYENGEILTDLPLSRLIWCRKTDDIRTDLLTGERLDLSFIHGHDTKVASLPTHTNLDNGFGKDDYNETGRPTLSGSKVEHLVRHSTEMTAKQYRRYMGVDDIDAGVDIEDESVELEVENEAVDDESELEATIDVEDADAIAMKAEFISVSKKYLNKLKNDLHAYVDNNKEGEIKQPIKARKLDRLAWDKYQTVFEALKQLEMISDAREGMEEFKTMLTSDPGKSFLSQRRDSWLIGGLKIACTLGTILIYRYLMGGQVTQGAKNAIFFSEQLKSLNASPTVDEDEASDQDPSADKMKP